MNTRWTVEYKMNGFVCTLAIETGDSGEIMKKAVAALEYLQKQGATPVAEPVPAAGTDQVPVCPVHGVAMKPSQHHTGFYCAKKNPDGTYCQEKLEV